MRLPFESEAAAELEAAAAWYERERRGYGAVFMSEVRRAVDHAAEFPQSERQVFDVDPMADARQFPLRRFPYIVVTAIIASQRAVVAIAHSRRQPGYWRDRLP